MAWKPLLSHRLGQFGQWADTQKWRLSTAAQRVSNSAAVQVLAKAPKMAPARGSVASMGAPSHR